MSDLFTPKRLVEIDLLNLATADVDTFVRFSETQYRNRLQHAAKTITEKGVKLILLTGPSACGKTTSSQLLAKMLTQMGKTTKVISLDNFFKNIEDYPRFPDGSVDYENVKTLDFDEIQRCFGELLTVGETVMPVFDFKTSHRSKEVEHLSIGNGSVIVEGIHALNPLITQGLSQNEIFKIYLSMREEYSYVGRRLLPTIDMRLARRLVRDYKYRNHSPQKTLSMWSHVCDGEMMYIKKYKFEADYLLDTSMSYEPCVMSPYVRKICEIGAENAEYNEVLKALCERFSLFSSVDEQKVPSTSLLREFIGYNGE